MHAKIFPDELTLLEIAALRACRVPRLGILVYVAGLAALLYQRFVDSELDGLRDSSRGVNADYPHYHRK